MLFPEIYSKPVTVTKLPWTVGLPAGETEAQTGSLTAQNSASAGEVRVLPTGRADTGAGELCCPIGM